MERSTPAADDMGLEVPWAPTSSSDLPFQVKNSGAAKITVRGDGWPKFTAFIGVDSTQSGINAVRGKLKIILIQSF